MTRTRNVKQTRDRQVRFKIWEAIRTLRTFTVRELCNMDFNRRSVEKLLAALTEQEYIELVEPAEVGTVGARYKLVRDPGVFCPAINRDELARQKFWQSIRILRSGFSVQQVCSTLDDDSPQTLDHCKKYFQALRKAGVIVKTASFKPGIRGKTNEYKLAKDLGPQAPIPRRTAKTLFDPNTNTELGRVE